MALVEDKKLLVTRSQNGILTMDRTIEQDGFYPIDIAIDQQGNFIALDGEQIAIFLPDDSLLRMWKIERDVKASAKGVTVDINGQILVGYGTQILFYDYNGNLKRFLGGFIGIRSIAMEGPNIVVAEPKASRVQVITPQGHFLRSIGPNRGPHILVAPNNVVIDGSGKFIILDTKKQSVLIFAPDGTFSSQVTRNNVTVGSGRYWFEPHAIGIDQSGNLLVLDKKGLMVFGTTPKPVDED